MSEPVVVYSDGYYKVVCPGVVIDVYDRKDLLSTLEAIRGMR